MKYKLLYIFVQLLIFWSRVLPRAWVQFFYGGLGKLGFHLVRKEREKAIRHLTMVYEGEKSPEEIRRIAKRVFMMIGRNFTDILRSGTVKDLAGFKRMVRIEGEEILDQAHADGKGVICLTCHMGAFELLASFLGVKGYKPLVIGTALKDKKLNDLLVGNRSRLGAEVIERGKDTMKIVRNLKGGGMMCILIDQDTKVKSRFVNFFGMPAATPIGATVLALKTGAKVIPMHSMLDEHNRQVIRVYDEIEVIKTGDEEQDLIQNTQRFNDVLEGFIRQDPTQWVWMHERWKTQPGQEIR